jgi:hypothetical protein
MMDNTTKHMVLSDGVAYVEAPEGFVVCQGCVFSLRRDVGMCEEAARVADRVFGRNCVTSDIRYIKADPQPQKVEG